MARLFPNNAANRFALATDVALLKMQENDHQWSGHFWAKLVATTGDQAFLAKYPGTANRGILLRTNGGGLGIFWIDPAAGGTGREGLSPTLTAGVWSSLGWHYHPGNNLMSVYLNGVLGTGGSGGSGFTYAGAQWKLGCRQGNTNPLDGDLAEITFWDNLSLSPAQFVALSRGVPPSKVQPGGVIGRWPLYGNEATTESDFSGNGNHFALTGTVARSDHAPMGR
jgi:hypothetical protein